MQLVRAGALQHRGESVGGLVEDLVDLQDLLDSSRRLTRLLVGTMGKT